MTAKTTIIAWSIALSVLILDQYTKFLALHYLPGTAITLLPDFAELVLVRNQGAAFGFLGGEMGAWRHFLLVGVALAAMAVILWMLKKTEDLRTVCALGLLLGGASGNLLDRLRFGWVVDFIHLHWHDLSWPVFNIADSAITVAVVLLSLDLLKPHQKQKETMENAA